MDRSSLFAKCISFMIVGAVISGFAFSFYPILLGAFMGLYLAISTSILEALHDLNSAIKRVENKLIVQNSCELTASE